MVLKVLAGFHTSKQPSSVALGWDGHIATI